MKHNNTRLGRIESLIQRHLSDIFIKEKDLISHNALISVMEVRISTDLSVVKVYLSIMPIENKQEIFDTIKSHYKFIRKLLGHRIKNLRKIPEIHFFLDDSFDKLQRINNLLKN
jgi:ribosome-binding factor A